VGGSPNSQVGFTVSALSNGNFVVGSPDWNGNRGAATWGSGTTGVSGAVSAANSLVGAGDNDKVGFGVTPLSNGNYVVSSPFWNRGGAALGGRGTAGLRGIVSGDNSLVGNNIDDEVGFGGVIPLRNGNYVLSSWVWNGQRGAATWGSGFTGV